MGIDFVSSFYEMLQISFVKWKQPLLKKERDMCLLCNLLNPFFSCFCQDLLDNGVNCLGKLMQPTDICTYNLEKNFLFLVARYTPYHAAYFKNLL